MGSPLDDAVRRTREAAASEASRRAEDRQRVADCRRQLTELVTDFLDRLESAGFPGGTEAKAGLFKRRRVYGLAYDFDEVASRRLFVSSDRRMLIHRNDGGDGELRAVASAPGALDERQLAELADNMASALRDLGVVK